MPRLALSLVVALVVALAAGLLPGVTATAYADTYYADYMPTAQDNAAALADKKVTFNGYEWYVIEDKSTAADAGTLTLLAADNVATGQKFADSSNKYSESAVRAYLDGLTGEGHSFAGVADAIVGRDLTDVTPSVTGAKLWLLSTQEANALPSDVVRSAGDYWWLRSPGNVDNRAAYVYDDGYVYAAGRPVSAESGVRPALQLNLKSVIFKSNQKSFELKLAYAVKVADGIRNGTVKVDKDRAAEGESVKVTARAADGYEIDTVTVTDAGGNRVPTKDGSFAMPASAVTVSVTFAKKADPEPTPEPVVTATVAKVARPSAVGSASGLSFKLSWKAAKGAKTYQVQWRAAGGKWQSAVTTKGTSYVVKGLKTGTAYELRVRGVNGSTKGAWSTPARRWLKSASKVRATAGKQSGTVKVTWAKDSKANAGHRVYVYARQGGKAVKTVEVAKGKTSVTIKGLKAGKTYHVRVRPMRKASGSTFSGLVSGYRAVKAAK